MELITRIRLSSSGSDAHGLPITTETETSIQGMVAARNSSLIAESDVLTVTEGLTLYLPSGTDVEDSDLFVVRGKRYVIDGEAFDWRNGLGSWNPGTVVNIKREQNA